MNRKVALPEMQHVCVRRQGQVRSVVDGQQRTVPSRRRRQDSQRGELVLGFERTELALACRILVAELDDVDATGEGSLGEMGQIAVLAPGVVAHRKR